MTNGAVLRLFPTIFGSKLAGWTAFLTALALTYVTLKAKASDDRKVVSLFLMILIVTFSFFHDDAHAFWRKQKQRQQSQSESWQGSPSISNYMELYMRRQPRWLYSEQENRGGTGSVLPRYCPSERRSMLLYHFF